MVRDMEVVGRVRRSGREIVERVVVVMDGVPVAFEAES